MTPARKPEGADAPTLWHLIKEIGGPVVALSLVVFIVRLDATANRTAEELRELRREVSAWTARQQALEVTAVRNTTRLESLERTQADDTRVQLAGRPR